MADLLVDAESQTANVGGEGRGDSNVPQTIKDVRAKAGVTLNKDGSPRKAYKKRGASASEGVSASPLPASGPAGFNEAQIKATFQGLFSLVALGTDCNVWFLADGEADVFIPSATLALNQTFPSVAQSKWGSLTLASLSLSAIVVAKTLLYFQYRQQLNEKAKQEPGTPKEVIKP